MPFKFSDTGAPRVNQQVLGTINTEKSYHLFVDSFLWGGGERNDVYFDEPNRHEFVTYRMDAAFIANTLTAENKKDMAVKLLDKVMAGITEHSYYYDYTGYFLAAAYYNAGAIKKADDLTSKIVRNSTDYINWAGTLNEAGKNSVADDIRQQFQIMQSLGMTALKVGDTAMAKTIEQKMNLLSQKVREQLNMRQPQGGGASEEN